MLFTQFHNMPTQNESKHIILVFDIQNAFSHNRRAKACHVQAAVTLILMYFAMTRDAQLSSQH